MTDKQKEDLKLKIAECGLPKFVACNPASYSKLRFIETEYGTPVIQSKYIEDDIFLMSWETFNLDLSPPSTFHTS